MLILMNIFYIFLFRIDSKLTNASGIGKPAQPDADRQSKSEEMDTDVPKPDLPSPQPTVLLYFILCYIF